MSQYHVLRQFGQWVLIEEGRPRPLATYLCKRDAFIRGLNYGADHGGRVTIHQEDGHREDHVFAEPRALDVPVRARLISGAEAVPSRLHRAA